MKVGDSVKFKDGRTGIVEDYDSLCYFVRDNNGNVCRIKKAVKDDPLITWNFKNLKEAKNSNNSVNEGTSKRPASNGYQIEELKTAEDAEKGYLTKEQGKGWVICGSDYWGEAKEDVFNNYASKGKIFLYTKNGEPYYIAILNYNGGVQIFNREDKPVARIGDSKPIKDSNVSINYDGENWIVNDNVNGTVYEFATMDDAVEKVETLMSEIENSNEYAHKNLELLNKKNSENYTGAYGTFDSKNVKDAINFSSKVEIEARDLSREELVKIDEALNNWEGKYHTIGGFGVFYVYDSSIEEVKEYLKSKGIEF